MKRILLASTAIVAFAGAAAAESHIGISFTGSAELGFNDVDIRVTAILCSERDPLSIFGENRICFRTFAAGQSHGVSALSIHRPDIIGVNESDFVF